MLRDRFRVALGYLLTKWFLFISSADHTVLPSGLAHQSIASALYKATCCQFLTPSSALGSESTQPWRQQRVWEGMAPVTSQDLASCLMFLQHKDQKYGDGCVSILLVESVLGLNHHTL